MRVAILHNPRPAASDASIPDDAFEEYDREETVAAIAGALAGLGVEPVPVVADRQCARCLEEGDFGFVFNLAEGLRGRCREAIPAAVCELLGLPFTGPDALTLAVTLDKAVARRVVAPDVPVAGGVLVDGENGAAQLARLRYPVLVKPNHEGSSRGIDARAICADPLATEQRCRWVRDRYDGPALAEEFLPGAEVTVGVQGNRSSARILGMMEIAPSDPEDEPFIYSIEAKRAWRERVRYHSPPRLPPRSIEEIRALALTAYRLLGCRDLARLDFRLDAAGSPTFLECNALPGLDPDNSDIVILSRGCIPYDALVQQVLLEAAERQGVRVP